MKVKHLFSVLGVVSLLCSLFLLNSCQSEEPKCSSEKEDATLTSQQTQLLKRLQAINDSVAALSQEEYGFSDAYNTQTRLSYDGMTLIQVIGTYDSKGFLAGWKNGWKSGKNFFNKLSCATAGALLTSASYSVIAAICYATHTEIPLQRPSVNQLAVISANVLTCPTLNSRTRVFLSENPDLNCDVDTEVIESAIAHNMILEHVATPGEILPTGKVQEVYTQEQLDYLQSLSYTSFYSAMPAIVAEQESDYSYTHVLGMSFENQIMDLYVTGVKGITATNTSSLVNYTKTLCREYIDVVNNSTTLNEDSQKAVLTSLYLAPLSVMHWSTNLPVE